MLCPDQIADRNKVVSIGAEPVDDLRQRGDGLFAVSAAIVQQHDVAAVLGGRSVDLRQRCIDDLLHPRPPPVARIDVQPDDGVAEPLGNCRWLQFVRSGRLGVTEIGRAEQLG